ncbi:MAG TPA: hypothetical protein VKB05_02660 [Pyrinomonadaceae bacterium]|nr:hypothetical protein [Pyrinomonadaceae bacterium]
MTKAWKRFRRPRSLSSIHGVLAYSVVQRTREIGVHGVGPTTINILSMVLGHGMLTIAVGVAIGLIGSLLLTRTLRSLLFGVSPNEAMPPSYIPARRATRVDPMVALRQSKRAAR